MHRCQSRCGEPRSICPAATFDFHLDEKSPYLANHDARAALTCLECGACTDWTR